MAYIANPLEEKKKDETIVGTDVGGGVKTLSQPAQTLGQNATASDVTETGTGQGAAAPVGGQNVSEQQKYLDANRQKSLDLASKTAGVVTGDINKAQTNLKSAADKYKAAVQAGTVGINQDVYGRASSALVDQTAPTWTQAQLDQFMSDQAAQDEFKKQYNAEYAGPKDILTQDYYAQAARDAAKAQKTMGLVNDMTGRQQLIARTYDNPSGRFSAGTLALDESLLSGYDEAYNQLLAAQDTGLGLNQQIADIGTMSAEEAKKAQETTKATQEAYKKQFNLGGEEGEIKTQTQAIQDKAKKDYEDYLKYIQNTYGVQEGVQATTYFDKPQDYLNVQAQNVMSKEDVARLKALEQLTGGVSTLTPFASQAGQYKDYIDPSADFRRTDFENKVLSEKGARLQREANEAARIKAIKDAEAAAAAAQKEAEKAATGTAIGTAAGAGIGFAVGGPIGGVVGGVVGGAIGGALCFDGDSEFEMSDGTYRKILDIDVGDFLKDGGRVYSKSKHALKGLLYSYPTGDEETYIWVTGKHAVKEDGRIIRVENSRKASVVFDHEVEFVYSLSCENHVMMSHGVCFADYDELDNSQGLTDVQCLNVLNGGYGCIQLM